MRTVRTKCISTRVNDEEYARLETLAGDERLGEWARGVLLKATTPAAEPILLAELLALRAILLNLHFAICSGDPVTSEVMHRLIERADQDKTQRAHDCLASATPGGGHD